jgi:P27 family predicted phage terminase small subunit
MKIEKEFKLKPGPVEKPAGLSPLAAREWDRLVGEMKRSGITLSPAFRGLIQQAACLSADIANAWAVIQRDGEYVTSKSGAVKLHPAVAHLSACRARLIFALIALGLSPRKGQAVEDDPPKDDPMAALLKPRRA